MMIDPRDINANTQQFFLLTCEGNWGEGRRKESRRRENSNPYLMFKKKTEEKCKGSNSISQQQTYHIYKLNLPIFCASLRSGQYVIVIVTGVSLWKNLTAVI